MATLSPLNRRFQRVLLLVTEDWFALSHFKPLISVLREVAERVTVVARSSGRRRELEALGVHVVDFDFGRRSTNPMREALTAARLARLFRIEKPDVVHLVAMKPIVLSSLALRFDRRQKIVLHVTGLGQLGFGTGGFLRLLRSVSLHSIAGLLKRPSTYLLVENSDDLEYLRGAGVNPGRRHAVVPGAGIDPQEFPDLKAPSSDPPVVAFVGRMIQSKGIDILMRAFEQLRGQNVRLELKLFGASDRDNRESIEPEQLRAWCERFGAQWHGHTDDILKVWSEADIFVLPARTREGMPRAMLEAAACARPLIVSDVPGCRHFVTDGIEGILVPAEDITALARAMLRLASDPVLRQRMGAAARRRLMDGFTDAHVKDRIRAAYRYLRQTELPSEV